MPFKKADNLTGKQTITKPFPDILTYPSIPKPLHGLNPRTIKGKEWWDETRKEAYKATGQRCIACWRDRNIIPDNRLDGHEQYRTEYKEGRLYYERTVPLCTDCHNFVHSGRLGYLIKGCRINPDDSQRIILRGLGICKKNDLKPFVAIKYAYELAFPGKKLRMAVWEPPNVDIPWHKWRLFIDREEHKPLFKTAKGWKKYYGN